MSETGTRSVAEIMGWDRCTIRQGNTAHVFHERPGQRGAAEPTPDDMLAWLDVEGYDVRTPYDTPLTDRPVWLVVTAGLRSSRFAEQFDTKVDGETLHAALEAAVRAVANE